MNRKEVLEQLEKIIPSFQRKWNGYGGTGNENDKYGFLYKDEPIGTRKRGGSYVYAELPFFIPKGFLEGIIVENCNDSTDKLISSPPRKKDERITISMHITSFAGYSCAEHTYGTLNIPGPRWARMNNPTSVVSGYMGDYASDANFDPRVQNWNIELCRIITEKDINSRANWDGWEVGSANQRFVSISEMFLTACYVALARVGSPFLLKGEESYVLDESKNLLSVDENGEVTFYDFFYNNITPGKHCLFNKGLI